MNEEYNNLGKVIKQLRKYRKLTQKELSENTGFSQNTISNHENGNRKISFNDIPIYAKGLGISEYVILKVNDELKNKGNSQLLENLKDFFYLYNFVNKAYYNESDIYYFSYDRFDETIEILEILNKAKINISNVSYEYVLDIYKQIVSNDVNKAYKSISRDMKLSSEELLSFNMKYAELLTNILKDQSNIDKEALISQANDLKKVSLNIGKRLQKAPNYIYDHIKGEPMYLVYSKKYPQRLDEFIAYLNK